MFESRSLCGSVKLLKPLNLCLEAIEQVDDVAVFLTKCVKTRVFRYQLASGHFVFGKLCQQ